MTEPQPGPPGGWVPPPPAAPGAWGQPAPAPQPGGWGQPPTAPSGGWGQPPTAPPPGVWGAPPPAGHQPGADPWAAPAAAGAQWPAGWAGAPGAQRRQWESAGLRRDLPLALAVALLVPLLGVPAGLLWLRLSARPEVIEESGGIFLDLTHDDSFFGMSASFTFVTLLAGLLVGAVVWALSRHRGPAVPAGLAVGAVAASFVARAVGERPATHSMLARSCGVDRGLDQICTYYDGHLRLDAPGALAVWAAAALAAYLLLTVVVDRPKNQSAYW